VSARRTDMVFPALRKVCPYPTCRAAGQPQPWSHFQPRKYWEDGITVRTVQAYCRPCAKERERERRRRTADLTAAEVERKRALARENYRRRRDRDPEYMANLRRYQRAYTKRRRDTDPEYRERRRKHARSYQAKVREDPDLRAKRNADALRRTKVRQMRAGIPAELPKVPGQRDRWLPISPFRDWLERELQQPGGGSSWDETIDREILADRLGVSTRRLYEWMHRNANVPESFVDSAGCNSGIPTLLADLYPEIYALDEAA